MSGQAAGDQDDTAAPDAAGEPFPGDDDMKHRRQPPEARVIREHDHEVIHPRNVLKARAVVIEDGPDVIDEQAVRRAERALDAIAHNFGTWMGEEAARLDEARTLVRRRPLDEPARAALYRRAHDIKGQGVTLGFPVAARAAASLCSLLDLVPWPAVDLRLVDQHVDAVLAIVREADDPERLELGGRLAEELEAAVRLQAARHAVPDSLAVH